jgi:thiamine pyrophosphate-dependent acetolactate synthase large subunit-like protein
VAVQRYQIKRLSGNFAGVADALGAYSEQISDPDDIVPAIQRGLEVTGAGRPAVLEFITAEEGAYSKFQFR